MIEIKKKQILLDGSPTLIMCGEIHYYRLKKSDWQDAINQLKLCGANAIATYIPWLCHEFHEGDVDLIGKTREELDLTGFLDLCEKNDLYIIARPGPFIMAEMKNEGIPFWVYEKFPDAIPVTWNNSVVPTKTLDYLNPDYLNSVKHWYSFIMPLLKKHLPENGGKIIAIQLDNEAGMLSLVSNSPDLTPISINLFKQWIEDTHQSKMCETYQNNFNYHSPTEENILTYHKDLGCFMRYRIKKYFEILKEYALEFGISGVPFLINIHGSEGGRAISYPVGISQLYESYQSDEFLSGSDIYMGDIHIGNFEDLYLSNIFTDCMNSEDQPLTAIEFEAGEADYGFNLDHRTSPSAVDIRTRMFIAQGNRLINYYLFSGGENYRFDKKIGDGNDRIASTGQKHGFSSPLGHNLAKTTTYDMTNQVINLVMTNNDHLATMTEEYDNLVFSFIPDYFMTEFCYPNSKKEREMIEALKRVRSYSFNVLAKSLLLTNHRFPAFNIQHKNLSKLKKGTSLVLTSSRYMSEDIQKNIIDFLINGGNIFIYGELPLFDMEGNDCRLLCDYLKVSNINYMQNRVRHHMSVYPCGFAKEHPEIPAGFAQTVQVENADVFLRVYENDEICGFVKRIGQSNIVCMLTHFHCNLELMKTLFEKVNIKNAIANDYRLHGIFMTTTKNHLDERFFHIMNLDDIEKECNIYENGKIIFNNLYLDKKAALMLPINVRPLEDVLITFSSAEIYKKSDSQITFRLTQKTDIIKIKTNKNIVLSQKDNVSIKKTGDITTIKILSNVVPTEFLIIYFNT